MNHVGSSVQQGQMDQYADDTTHCLSANSIKELKKAAFVDLHGKIQYLNELDLKANFAHGGLWEKDSVILKQIPLNTLDQGLIWPSGTAT